jgi:hypothetical protein
VTTQYTGTLLHEAVGDLRRLEDFAIARELASETPDEIVGDNVVVGAVRHQREEDYRH